MVSRSVSKSQKPKVPVSDPEITRADHDELFNWLITHLDEVTTVLWPHDDYLLPHMTSAAIDTCCSNIAAEITALQAIEESLGDAAALRSQFHAKTGEAAQLLEGFAAPVIGPAELRPQVKSWRAQRELFATDVRGTQTKLAGFVDVYASVSMAESISLHAVSIAFETRFWGEEERQPDPNRWTFYAPRWEVRRRSHDVYFDVRANVFSLGEILQQLRTLERLATLQPEAAREVEIVLVVNELNASWKETLAHEGFGLLERKAVDGTLERNTDR
jgi:hypothetical protein